MKTANFEHQKPIKGIFIGWHDASGSLMIKPNMETSNVTPKKVGTYVLLHESDWDYIGNLLVENSVAMIAAKRVMDLSDTEINELKLKNDSLLEQIKSMNLTIQQLLQKNNVV